MLRKLFKTGNSIVVSLPKNIIEPLGISEGAEVSVGLDRKRGQVVIRPVTHPATEEINSEFARQLAEFIEEYRPALEALSR